MIPKKNHLICCRDFEKILKHAGYLQNTSLVSSKHIAGTPEAHCGHPIEAAASPSTLLVPLKAQCSQPVNLLWVFSGHVGVILQTEEGSPPKLVLFIKVREEICRKFIQGAKVYIFQPTRNAVPILSHTHYLVLVPLDQGFPSNGGFLSSSARCAIRLSRHDDWSNLPCLLVLTRNLTNMPEVRKEEYLKCCA